MTYLLYFLGEDNSAPLRVSNLSDVLELEVVFELGVVYLISVDFIAHALGVVMHPV